MNLQAKLTLGNVLLAALIVVVISAVYLGNGMQEQFEATLERADMLKTVAADQVKLALNRQRTVPLRGALRDPGLVDLFTNIMLASHAILEVAVVDPHANDEILLDSIPDRLGVHSPPYEDFRPLVSQTGWYDKLRVLMRSETRYYQLDAPLGSPQETVLDVRVIIDPALIRNDIAPSLTQSARVALISLIGAVIATFLFSAVAFRRLRHVGRMLDLAARGEYEPEKGLQPKRTGDELSIMASNVSMLSQRLRGAQYEVSDLRGNIDRLLQDLEDAVFIFSRDRRLVFASGSVERLLGKQRSDLPGQPIEDVFPPNTTLGLLIAQSSETGRPVRNRRLPLAGYPPGAAAPATAGAPNWSGTVLLSVDLLDNVPGTTGSGVLVRLRDPEAQRKLGRELQTADRLAAISRISSGVAHEVKNPLNAILLHVEVARAKLARGDTEVEPQMEIISREILRLDRVVKTFLDFSRPVELNLSTVPLGEFMNEIAELARPQAGASGIRVIAGPEAEGVEVRVDRDLLKQAVLNVVVNAMQAMPEGGELRLEASAIEDTAEIRIGDTGAGIPVELREKIFRLYFTTKKEGSGIGLAMTFRIVQLHDGTIDFTSEPGKGTTFFIRLPIAV
jgi:signal transduction histidine kinase